MIDAIEQSVSMHEAVTPCEGTCSGSLAGAVIDDLLVLRREKPGKRAFYVCHDVRDGAIKRLRGYELVRLARHASGMGLPVAMPRETWRDEEVSG